VSQGGRPRLRRLLPDAVLADAGSLVRGQALLVDGDRVLGFGEPDHPETEAFPGELWCAAPVLTHAHLESFDAPAAGWPRDCFAEWADALVAWRQAPRLGPEQSAAASLERLAARGCGLVAAHVGEPASRSGDHERAAAMPELLAMPELFEPDPERAAEVWSGVEPGPVALHSPFGVSLELAQLAFEGQGLVSIHLGEHAEERRLLSHGDGPLASLFRRRGRPLPPRRWASPVDWLEQAAGARPGTLAVHGGDLDADELERLRGAGVALSWCPGTHLWFDRPRPAFLEAGGALPSLGCDSRASNEDLDPLREFRLACALLPEAGPQAWWRAATETGALQLDRPELGHLRAGASCRPLRLPLDQDLDLGRGGAAAAAAACAWIAAAASLGPLGPAVLPA